MEAIKTEHVLVTTTGSAGSASGTGATRRPLNGLLLAIYVDYTSQPSTTDVTIATTNAPVKTLLTLTDANTDGWFYPKYASHNSTGTASTSDLILHPLNDYITVTVAQGDAASIDVYILYVS